MMFNYTKKSVDKLMREVRYSYENVPFYKRHLDEAGFDIRSVKSVADIARLPLSLIHI